MLSAARASIKAVRIDRRGERKLIEIHARLGEDPGLAALMSDEDPLAVIERACARSRATNFLG